MKLDEHDGIIGVITSDEFAGLEAIDRQNRVAKSSTVTLARKNVTKCKSS